MFSKQCGDFTYLAISSIAREAANDLMTLRVVQRHVRALLGVLVRIEFVFLSDAKMRHIPAVLPDDVSLGIVQTKTAVLNAELPAASHGPVIVVNTEGLAFGHADLGGLVAPGADGVVDTSKARVRNRGRPVLVGSAIDVFVCIAVAEAGDGNVGIGIGIGIGREDALGRRKGQQRGEEEFHTGSSNSSMSGIWY